jgi:hypothetical protein
MNNICNKCHKEYIRKKNHRSGLCDNCYKEKRKENVLKAVRTNREKIPKKIKIKKQKALYHSTKEGKDGLCFIYVLKDDTGKIRYVGQTVDLNIRFSQHIYGAMHPNLSISPNTYKNLWIRKMLSDNKAPIMEMIEETTLNESNAREKYWIQYYKENGCKLTNTTIGGRDVLPKNIMNMFFHGESLFQIKFKLYEKTKMSLLSGLKNYIEAIYGNNIRKIDRNNVFIYGVSVDDYVKRIQNLKNPFIGMDDNDVYDVYDYFVEFDNFPIEFLERVFLRMLNE